VFKTNEGDAGNDVDVDADVTIGGGNSNICVCFRDFLFSSSTEQVRRRLVFGVEIIDADELLGSFGGDIDFCLINTNT
jgi:hypothetical protein